MTPNEIADLVVLEAGETFLDVKAGIDMLRNAPWRLETRPNEWGGKRPWTDAFILHNGVWLEVDRTDCMNRVDTGRNFGSDLATVQARWIKHVVYGLILSPTPSGGVPRVCCVDALTDG